MMFRKSKLIAIFSLVAILPVHGKHLASNDDIGVFIKPGTYKGKIAVINQQTLVAEKDVKDAVSCFAEFSKCNVQVSSSGDGAAVTLTLIENDNEPILLIAPVDHWGKLNVAKLTDDLPGNNAKKKFITPRTRRMIINSLSLLCGGGSSSFQGNLMNAASIRELDQLKEQIPIDMYGKYVLYLRKLGVTQKETANYFDACCEGWAPAPSNDVQQSIWNKIHKPPEKPIKITYDKDKQKPIVK